MLLCRATKEMKRDDLSYFPAFLKLENKKILLVGGGSVACAKLRHLLDFTADISVIAAALSDETKLIIQENNLPFWQRDYKKGDIRDFDLVIVAADDIALQAEIFEESREYNCLCNCVDSAQYCDFIFGSYIKKDDLTIAISTSGTSPALAKQLKNYLQELLPHDIGSFLKEMKSLRERLPKGKERMKMLEEKAKNYIQKWSK